MTRTFCNFLNVFIVHKNSENLTICFPNYVLPFIVSINFLLLLCLNALPLQQWSNSSGADSHVGYFPTHRTTVIIHRPERPDYHLTVSCFRMDLERLLMLSGWKCNALYGAKAALKSKQRRRWDWTFSRSTQTAAAGCEWGLFIEYIH